MIGQTISHYQILEKLGEGGMGVVYKAQDTTLDRLVALKFLPPHLSASDEDKARFIQEAKAAAALNHPNICTIHGIEEHDGQMFIAEEFVEGQTLRERSSVGADHRSALQAKQAVEIGIQLADGLAAAHEKGIVHRDLKPENIMIQKDGRVRIMDFGLAKLKGASRLTKAGSTVGTAGYMSPEQVQGMETDHRTDIFSLGVLLYELFAGQSPFKGVHETAVNYEIVNVEPEPMSSVKPEIAPELDNIVLECLVKDLTERTQSVAEVAKDLRHYRRESSRTQMSRVMTATSAQKVQMPAIDTAAVRVAGRAIWKTNLLPWIIAGVFSLTSIFFSYVYLSQEEPVRQKLSYLYALPEKTNFAQAGGGHLALSPDGKHLAYVALDSAGNRALYVRPLDMLTAHELPGTTGASFPFWSPDGRYIGFFSGGKLKRIDVGGGPTLTVADAVDSRGGAWNKAGFIIFGRSTGVLSRVSAGGGEPAAITAIDTTSTEAEKGHRWPSFLPDENHFLYLRARAENGDLYVGSLDGKIDKQLSKNVSNAFYTSGYIVYSHAATLMAQPFDPHRLEFTGDPFVLAENINYSAVNGKGAFTLSQNSILAFQVGQGHEQDHLIWYDRNGKELSRLATGRHLDLMVSLDGKRLAVDYIPPASENRDIWIYDLGRNLKTRFTFNSAFDRTPVWSPDGSQIVFSSNRKGSYDLWIKESSGAKAEELLFEYRYDCYATDWSRDGKYITFTVVEPGGGFDLWILPLDGQKKVYPFLKTEFVESDGRFSPDGRWLAYRSNISGRNEVYVRPFPGPGGVWQISTNGGGWPLWSPDGKEIYFVDPNDKLMTAEIMTQENTVDVRKIRELFQTNAVIGSGPRAFGVTPDGKRFIIRTRGERIASPPLTFVVNWDSGIR